MANQPTPAQQAAAIVHAQYVPIDYALAQQRASDAKAQAALQAAGHALIAQLQGGIKPAGQAYDAAVNQQQALAQGGAHLLAGLNPNAQIQSNLQQIGAPVEQQQMLQRQTQAQFPGQGGVLNIEQGTIPGASLVAQKAAAQQFLAGLPTLAGLSQQRSAQGLAAQAAQNRQSLYGQRLQAAAQIPQLAYNIGEAQTNRQFQAQQAADSRAFSAAQAALGRQLTPYEKAQIAHQNRIDNQNAAVLKAQKRAGGLTAYQSSSLAERKREFNARQGQTKGSVVGGGKYKPPTGADLQKQADLAYYGQEPILDANGNVKTQGVKAINYQAALFGMLNSGVKLPVAQRYLNQFYAPGERGRPRVSFQQRQARKRGG